MKWQKERKNNNYEKGALAYIQGFLRKQAQITTGAIQALHSKPEVETKAKRSLKAITYLNRTNEDPKSRKKGERHRVDKGKRTAINRMCDIAV